MRIAALAIPIGLLSIPLFFMILVRTPYMRGQYEPVAQPVLFDHRHHVIDDAIDCTYCHYEAERSRYAGVPPTEVCMGCHSQVWVESPLLAPVRASMFENTPIVWNRVHRLPDFVQFEHAPHLKKGVGCVSCHGRVDLMAQVFATAPMAMQWCLDCHRNPEPHLRPLDRLTDMTFRPAGDPRLLGAELRKALDVNPPTHCSACHY